MLSDSLFSSCHNLMMVMVMVVYIPFSVICPSKLGGRASMDSFPARYLEQSPAHMDYTLS